MSELTCRRPGIKLFHFLCAILGLTARRVSGSDRPDGGMSPSTHHAHTLLQLVFSFGGTRGSGRRRASTCSKLRHAYANTVWVHNAQRYSILSPENIFLKISVNSTRPFSVCTRTILHKTESKPIPEAL